VARGGGYGRIQVDGARQLRASLKQAERGVQDLKDTHLAVARLVDDAADADPRRPRRITGALDASSRPAGTQREALVRIGRARVPYAGPVHWGWPARHIRPNPWVYRAVREHEDPALDLYLQHMNTIIDRIEGTHTP
jgi:hypothetical protein